jgi:hypothetical protein
VDPTVSKSKKLQIYLPGIGLEFLSSVRHFSTELSQLITKINIVFTNPFHAMNES